MKDKFSSLQRWFRLRWRICIRDKRQARRVRGVEGMFEMAVWSWILCTLRKRAGKDFGDAAKRSAVRSEGRSCLLEKTYQVEQTESFLCAACVLENYANIR